MEENKPEVKPATAAAPDDKGIQQIPPVATELNLVERAEKAARDIREANAEKLVLIEREERAKAKEMLGGTAEAGTPQKPVRTPEEQAQRDKVIAYGKATGAKWALKMEEDDKKAGL